MRNEIISIIVPIYNIEDYLCQCLDSLVNQTLRALEIILVDDGSTDKSAEICDEYASKDSRIRVIHKQNEGLVRARKTGLAMASGDLIGFVDGDDWIEPDMFEQLYNAMFEHSVDIVMCGRYEDTGQICKPVYHGIVEGRYDKNAMKEIVYPHMIVNGAFFEWGIFPGLWDKLFKRKALEKYQMLVDDRLTMGEDAACTYPAILNADSIYVLHKCLYHYRQSANSMVKKVIDYEILRQKFNILYNSVNIIFEKYKDIYDLREQWMEYVLFLMVPRAGMLYKDIEKLDYLFPFCSVKKGSNIVIYGMGTYGQLLYRHVKETNFCNIVACADKNFVELRKQGIDVVSPDDISEYEYEAIVIANSFSKVRESIYNDLISRYPEEKIFVLDEKLIKADDTLRSFGIV